jgi:serine/threonine protein phosphatase 1
MEPAMLELTDGERIYAVGDVHGCAGLLEEMLERVRADLAARPHPRPHVVMLGDYVDRGADTRGVIEMLLGLERSALPATFLLGNHDELVLGYLEDPGWSERAYHWLHASMGGWATLASYGVSTEGTRPERAHAAFVQAFPASHRQFLERCALMHRTGGYAFVHAGIRPGVPLDAQDREDLVWIRDPFLSSTDDHGVKVVHGHTIVDRVQHHPNRIAVDTGAVRSGVLSCVVLEGAAVALLTPRGPEPLPEGAGRGLRGLGGVVRSGLRGLWPARRTAAAGWGAAKRT